jgi:hypothetical protein
VVDELSSQEELLVSAMRLGLHPETADELLAHQAALQLQAGERIVTMSDTKFTPGDVT